MSQVEPQRIVDGGDVGEGWTEFQVLDYERIYGGRHLRNRMCVRTRNHSDRIAFSIETFINGAFIRPRKKSAYMELQEDAARKLYDALALKFAAATPEPDVHLLPSSGNVTIRNLLDFVQSSLELTDKELAWYLGLHPKQLSAFKAGREQLPEAANLILLHRTGRLTLSKLVLDALSPAVRDKLKNAEAKHAEFNATRKQAGA